MHFTIAKLSQMVVIAQLECAFQLVNLSMPMLIMLLWYYTFLLPLCQLYISRILGIGLTSIELVRNINIYFIGGCFAVLDRA